MNTKLVRESKNKHDKIFYETMEEVMDKVMDKIMDKVMDKDSIYKIYLKNKNQERSKLSKKIENFEGPFIGKYLKGYSPQFKNKYFNTIQETLSHFHKDHFALGITLNRNGKFTIRRSNKLINSTTNTNGNTEISWIFIPPKKTFHNNTNINNTNINSTNIHNTNINNNKKH